MTDSRLAAAADQAEITGVLTRYCHALDRRNWALLGACFHSDSAHWHGPYEGPSSGFVAFAQQVLAGMEATHHQLGPPLIRLEGDVAFVETYFTAYHRIPAETGEGAVFQGAGAAQDLIIGGRYIDRFERRGGLWKIANRRGVHDWQRLEPAADGGFLDLPAAQRGHHGPEDPAWAVPTRLG